MTRNEDFILYPDTMEEQRNGDYYCEFQESARPKLLQLIRKVLSPLYKTVAQSDNQTQIVDILLKQKFELHKNLRILYEHRLERYYNNTRYIIPIKLGLYMDEGKLYMRYMELNDGQWLYADIELGNV